MIILTSNIYLKGLKQSLTSYVQIDTFNFDVYYQSAESELITSVDVTTGFSYGSYSIDLPMDRNDIPIRYSSNAFIMKNNGKTAYWKNDLEMSKAFAGVIMGTKSVTIETDIPIQNPYIEISFEGNTREATTADYSSYPNWDAGSQAIVTFVNNIGNPATSWTVNSSNVNYDMGYMNINPYVKKVTVATSEIEASANLTPSADVIVPWTGGYGTWWSGARRNDWVVSFYNDTTKKATTTPGTKLLSWPSVIYANDVQGQMPAVDQMMYGFTAEKVEIVKELQKAGDYEYTANITVPLKYVSMAVTRYSEGNALYDQAVMLQHKAFYDTIKKVTVSLYGTKYVASHTTQGFSLDEYGGLTTSTINSSILSITGCEFIKTDTYHLLKGIPWSRHFSLVVLEKYKDGKYVVHNCKIPGRYALKNKITIDTEIQIKLLDNTFISKVEDGVEKVCTFLVKNITKVFDKEGFYYELSLLEDEGITIS